MLRCGTTTCEAKSGYGLDDGRRAEDAARRSRAGGQTTPIEISPTFMGAHEIPVEYRDGRRAYIDLIVDEMIPAVARERLAEWCDVFCETGVFTPEESREILEAGRAAGLKLRIHADELAAERRIARRRRRRRAIGGSSDLRRRGAAPRPRGRRRRRHAAADRVVLSEARTLRAGADADRARRRGRARDRRQPGRRLLAVDAVRDDARPASAWA